MAASSGRSCSASWPLSRAWRGARLARRWSEALMARQSGRGMRSWVLARRSRRRRSSIDRRLGRLHAQRRHEPVQLRPAVLEVGIEMRDHALLRRGAQEQERVVLPPKLQPEDNRAAAALVERSGHVQRIAQTDERPHVRQKALPEREGDAAAGILETPDRRLIAASRRPSGFRPLSCRKR